MKKIMVIDDEEDFCFFLKNNLEAEGEFEVVVCNDGFEGLKKIKEVRPNLVLLDVMMPKISGPDVAIRLQNDKNTQNIPVVFLTAIVREEETVGSGNFIGGEYFVSKPVKIKELAGLIDRLAIG